MVWIRYNMKIKLIFFTVFSLLMIGQVNAEWPGDLLMPWEKEKLPEKKIVTTGEEFVKGLSVTPPAKSVFIPQGTRGLGGIESDDGRMLNVETLRAMPTVGALILFDYDSAAIKDESKPLLREMGQALNDQLKEVILVLAGHTDSIGSDGYNLQLSHRRAKAVKQFFISEFQIDSSRLIVVGFGEQEPIESNDTPEGRSINRRVEFVRVQ